MFDDIQMELVIEIKWLIIFNASSGKCTKCMTLSLEADVHIVI